jgi:DNA-binding transcriptional MerR regulator
LAVSAMAFHCASAYCDSDYSYNRSQEPSEGEVPEPDLTVEALSSRLETRVSTIRLYQREGLLPPPEVRGRVAYYSSEHVARFRLIARLQGRGFSLAAIRALLETWERGGSLDDLVGPEAHRSALRASRRGR